VTTILTMCHIMSFVTKICATCLKQLNIVIVAHCGIYNWKLTIHNWKNQSLICKFLVIICLPSFLVYVLPTCASSQAYFALPPSPPPQTSFVTPFTYFILPPYYLLRYFTCLSLLLLTLICSSLHCLFHYANCLSRHLLLSTT
jgi:hypothetical protein